MGGDHLCYWESICMSGLVSQMYLFFFCCKKMGSRKYTCVYVCAHMCVLFLLEFELDLFLLVLFDKFLSTLLSHDLSSDSS